MTLVVDASVAFWGCGEEGRLEGLGDELVAPPLMWSEVSSALHEAVWRREVRRANATALLELLGKAPIAARAPRGLLQEAWRIADELGWAKTYDAEYVALASLLDCRLVTLDTRLRRGGDRLGYVIALGEL